MLYHQYIFCCISLKNFLEFKKKNYFPQKTFSPNNDLRGKLSQELFKDIIT